MVTVNASVKSIVRVRKIIVGMLAHVFEKNSRYLKSIADDSVIALDEITNVTDSVSTNVTSTVSINSDDKNVPPEKIVSLFTLPYY